MALNSPCSDLIQSAGDILDQILAVLQPDRQPHHPVADPHRRTFLRGQALMGGGGRVGNQAFCIAKIIRDINDFQSVEESERRLLAAGEIKSNDRTAPPHLPPCQRGLGMVVKQGIAGARQLGMAIECLGNAMRAVGLLTHTQGQGLQSLEQHPGIERAQRRPGMAQELLQVTLAQLFACQNRAAQYAALPSMCLVAE